MIAEPKQAETNESLFIRAYETSFPKLASFVRKMGGSVEETKDIFQDALVIYYEKKVASGFSSEQDEIHYIYGISRHLWFKKFRTEKSLRSLNTLPQIKIPEEEPGVSENLFRFIELSGKKCLDLLKGFYYDKMNMKDLSEKFGFSGERSAASQKFKCLQKVRSVIKERSLTKADFYE